MKSLTLILTSLTLFAFTSVQAGHYDDDYSNDYDYAKVVNVQAVYETHQVPQDRRVCNNYRTNQHNASHRGNTGGAIVGGIIGGLIGNRFGKGHGRDAATAAGVIAGAAIGSKAKHRGHNTQTGRQCYTETTYFDEQRIAGYDVSYNYNGRIYQSRMQNHPGKRVKVQVSVQVAEY